MTAYQVLVQTGEGKGEQPSSDEERWEQAPAPAQVGRRLLHGVFGTGVPATKIRLLTNAMHWLYGTTLGAVYRLVQGTREASPVVHGLLFGSGARGWSYVQLVPMGLYQPPWEYPRRELAKDLSYHLVYGLGVAAAYEAVRP